MFVGTMFVFVEPVAPINNEMVVNIERCLFPFCTFSCDMRVLGASDFSTNVPLSLAAHNVITTRTRYASVRTSMSPTFTLSARSRD